MFDPSGCVSFYPAHVVLSCVDSVCSTLFRHMCGHGNLFLFLHLPYILKECHLTNVNLFVQVSVHRPPRSCDCDVFRFVCYCDGVHPAVGGCAAHHTVVLCKSNITV